jgi:hypothetical protein
MLVIGMAAAIAVAILAGVIGYRAFGLWWTYRGARVITCPENLRPAGIFVDTGHVAVHPFTSNPRLRLSSCSRWPERAPCGQDCLSEVADAPRECLVRNILVRWYADKHCVSCGRLIGEITAAGVKPAVLRADKISVEWSEIPAEQLPETLVASAPICFTCHIGNLLVRTHPELAVDRHRNADLGTS